MRLAGSAVQRIWIPPMSTPHVELADVTKIYESGSLRVTALSGVTATIAAGERVALLGKSGSGKSTLLNLLGGLDRATSGRICVCQRRLDQLTSRQLADFRFSTVGMIFQSYNLIDSKTALANVELPLVFAGTSRQQRRAMAARTLDAVGLGDRLQHLPAELSGGEQQRVAIARALVNRPTLLLADEPTGNLDSETVSEVMQMLDEDITRHSIAVLLVTHDEELAAGFADRLLRLKDGHLVDD